MSAWQSFARISGVAFQVFAAVGLGILAGYGVEHLAPSIHPAGVLVGAAVGFGAAIYLMVTGLRAYISSETPAPGGKANKE
ncbi:MAG TPA: AtpZ/AtpI family protein [Candidatus Solibacter sp.]|nr:AtpZ/AtpI family protein [Candidatus Solibacter sp.]